MDDQILNEIFDEDITALTKARKLEAKDKAELLMAVADIMDTDAGRCLLWWLLGETHVFQSSFTGNSATYFKEGERSVGLKLFGLVLEARPLGLQELVNFRRSKEV
jgi:hypothetical protein